MVEANKESLLELINILVDNAIKYSRPKGKIVISTDKTGSSTSFSVHDNGIGIDPFDLPHIFDRFYRADSSRSKSKTDGYGLGLSIAKEIVDHHGGTINVESSLKAGTTFKVKL
jgi:signal transduction histidine kinase